MKKLIVKTKMFLLSSILLITQMPIAYSQDLDKIADEQVAKSHEIAKFYAEASWSSLFYVYFEQLQNIYMQKYFEGSEKKRAQVIEKILFKIDDNKDKLSNLFDKDDYYDLNINELRKQMLDEVLIAKKTINDIRRNKSLKIDKVIASSQFIQDSRNIYTTFTHIIREQCKSGQYIDIDNPQMPDFKNYFGNLVVGLQVGVNENMENPIYNGDVRYDDGKGEKSDSKEVLIGISAGADVAKYSKSYCDGFDKTILDFDKILVGIDSGNLEMGKKLQRNLKEMDSIITLDLTSNKENISETIGNLSLNELITYLLTTTLIIYEKVQSQANLTYQKMYKDQDSISNQELRARYRELTIIEKQLKGSNYHRNLYKKQSGLEVYNQNEKELFSFFVDYLPKITDFEVSRKAWKTKKANLKEKVDQLLIKVGTFVESKEDELNIELIKSQKNRLKKLSGFLYE